MTLKVKPLILITAGFLMLTASLLSADSGVQEFYPFLAEVTADRVHVRAGQSKNFESLCVIGKDDEIVVVDKNYSWYKVKLPVQATVFIHAKYIQRLGKLYGEVTGDRINVRAGADINYSVLGQLNKGDKVRIVLKDGDWYKIEPIADIYGWILNEYIAFKSKSIKSYLGDLGLQKVDKDTKPAKVAGAKENLKDKIQESNKAEVKPVKKIVLNGYLRPVQIANDLDLTYQLLINDHPLYYLKGERRVLSAFDAFKVTVEGTVEEKIAGPAKLPVLNLSKIKILL